MTVTGPVLPIEVSTPLYGSIVPIVVEEVDQVPPRTMSDKESLSPWHTTDVPNIGPGAVVTFTVVVAIQPVVVACAVITVDTPAVAPAVTTPVVAPIVATAGRLLVQVTGETTVVSMAVVLAHMDVGPVIVGTGLILTVTLPVIVREQPAAFVATTV